MEFIKEIWKDAKGFVILWIFLAILAICFWTAVIWVAIHFISKWW